MPRNRSPGKADEDDLRGERGSQKLKQFDPISHHAVDGQRPGQRTAVLLEG
jgi:hypothetical protein